MTKEEFIEIITKCQSGDKKAIGVIYNEYFGRMCITAFGIVNDSDVAYDIASNVILKLLELLNHNKKEGECQAHAMVPSYRF